MAFYSANAWNLVTPPSGPIPSARQLASMAWVTQCAPPSDCLILIGGLGPATPGTPSVRLGDVWVFYTSNRTWASPAAAQVGRPPAGHSAAAVASPDGSKLYYYGGDTAAGISGDIFVVAPRGDYTDLNPADMVDIALQNIANQSTTYCLGGGGTTNCAVAGLAVDGNVADTLLVNGVANCAATIDTTTGQGINGVGEYNPWWMVDLGTSMPFTAINIFTRDKNEAGAGRNAGFQIWYGDSPIPPPSGADSKAPPGGFAGDGVTPLNKRCVTTVTDIDASQLLVPCSGVARYFFYYLPPNGVKNRYLELCEFQVLQVRPWAWRQLSGITNAALFKPTSQSSIYFNGAWAGDASYAVDGILSSLWPYFTQTAEMQTDCTNIYWQVDLGAVFDISTLKVWTRLDCCSMRRQRFEIYIGTSSDWAQDQRVLGPLDITPPNGVIFTTYPVTSRGRYVTFRKIPYDATNCNNVPNGPGGAATDDKNVISLSEVQVMADKLLDNPPARAAMAYTAFRGTLVVTGGSGATGVRLNDVRFFDMLTNAWLPPALPLGTPPVARMYAVLLPLPNKTTPNTPSTEVMLIGGINTAGDTMSEVSILAFPSCSPSPFDAAPAGQSNGIQTEVCNTAGTICVYTCQTANGFQPANPANNMLICSPSGVWEGVMPVCVPVTPPTAVTTPANSLVSVANGGDGTTVKVTWTASAGGTWPASSYRVSVTPHDWVESFATGGFDNASAWHTAVPDVQQDSALAFSPSTGELILDGGPGAACASANPYNCFSVYRDWPTVVPAIPPTGSWALEALMRMDDTTSRMAQNSQNIGLGIFDAGVNRSSGQLGVMQFYAGLRRNANVWQYGWESLYSSWNNWFTDANQLAAATIFVRIERDATLGTWTSYFKFREQDDWILNPRTGYDALLVNGATMVAKNIKIGLVARTWGGTARCLGFFKYIRLAPLLNGCNAPGSTRVVAASSACAGSSCSTLISGLTPQTAYNTRIEAGTIVAFAKPVSAPSTISTAAAVAHPFANATAIANLIATNQLVEVAVPRAAYAVQPSVWANIPAGFGPKVVFDGALNTYAQAGNPLQDNGDWWGIDLGDLTAVKTIFIVNRQDCCQQRTQYLEWFVGNAAPPHWNENAMCPPANYPGAALVSTNSVYNPSLGTLPYAAYFPCDLVGRYLFMRAPQSLGVQDAQDGQFNIAEIRVYASNSCPARNGTGVSVSTPTLCQSGTYGSVCVLTCLPGYTAVSGESVSRCDGDSWDAPPLVCSPICQDLDAPPYVGACLQTIYSTKFPLGSESASESNWMSLSPYLQPFGSVWFVRDGHLEASTKLGCNADMHAVIASNRIAGYYGDFTLTASVSTADRAGLVFRATDDLNMYRFYLDLTLLAPVHVLERVQDGYVQRITDAPLAIAIDSWHVVSVTMVNTLITVMIDGVTLMSASDNTFLAGHAGVYAATSALFTGVSFVAPCNGACTGAQNGETCAFTCHEGLIPVGPTVRTCVALPGQTVNGFGVWSPPANETLTCTVAPPVFIPSTISVLENSPRNTDVGDPLLASAAAPDYQLQFSIFSETPLDPAYGTLFYIDACSGQVRLRQGGINIVNYERQNNYTLIVVASVVGFPDATTTQTINVRILNVDEVPLVPMQIFNVTENSLTGFRVGTITYADPENSPVSWLLTSDTSHGSFLVNNVTGRITVTNGFDVVAANGDVTAVTGYIECSQIGEQSSQTLSCAPGYVVTSFDFASYGTATGTCGNYKYGACHASDTMGIVSAACIGLGICTITSANAVFLGE